MISNIHIPESAPNGPSGTDPATNASAVRTRRVQVADLYCGAGGTSTGLLEACEESGFNPSLTAINHWPVAIATHTANHPAHRHLCTSIDDVNPRELYPEGGLDILWGSPECIFFSTARGGKPINDQRRASPWCILRWAESLQPPVILIENVKEFTKWGPLNAKGRPIKARQGETFIAWVRAIESQGYRVEWRVLCAADYGDPTTRERLFIFAVRGQRKIIWPEPTHRNPKLLKSDASAPSFLFAGQKGGVQGSALPWVPAREIIDWSDKGKSIFGRKKPLAPKTMDRILIGLQKFGLAPFIIPQHRGGEAARSINKPVSTITTTSRGIGVAEPYLVCVTHGDKGKPSNNNHRPRSIDRPLPTVAAGGIHHGLAQPYLVELRHSNKGQSVDKPLSTVTAGGRHHGLVHPYIIGIDQRGGGASAQPIDAPLSTVITKQKHAVCAPYLVQYNGSSDAHPITNPLGAVTTRERFGLCFPSIGQPGTGPIIVEIAGKRYQVDILFRMLKWRELARAQGFHDTYKFTGKATDIVKQIGNAVPRNLAKALGKAALTALHSNKR